MTTLARPPASPRFSRARLWNRFAYLRYEPTIIVAIVLTVVLTYLVLAPVGAMIVDTVHVQIKDSATTGLATGTWTAAFFQRAFLSRVSEVLFWAPLRRTLFVSLVVSVVAIPLGALMAWLLVRTDLPGRRWLSSAMVVPYMLPSWTFAVAWLNLFKNRRLGGLPSFAESLGFLPPDWLAYGALPIIVCEALHLFPFAFLLFGSALRSMDTQLEESARVLGARGRTITRRVVLPLLMPSLLSAFLLTFSRVVGSFGTPYILGSGTKYTLLPTSLYSSYRTGSPGVAAVIALVMILLGVTLVAADMYFVREYRRFVTIGGKGGAPRIARLGGARVPLMALVWGVVAISLVVPIGTLVLSTIQRRPGVFTPENFTLIYWIGSNLPAMPGQNGLFFNKDILSAALTSIKIAGAAAITCGVAGLFTGYVVVRFPGSRLSGSLRQISFLPYLVPSIGFAAACLSLFAMQRGPIPSLYGTMILVVIVMSVKYLPYASRAGISAMMQLGREPEEAAMICGAPWIQRMRRIIIPIQKTALMTGILLPFISGMKEQSLVIMLATPGTELLTTQVLRYIDYGYSQLANATVLAIVVIIFTLTTLTERFTRSSLAAGLEGKG